MKQHDVTANGQAHGAPQDAVSGPVPGAGAEGPVDPLQALPIRERNSRRLARLGALFAQVGAVLRDMALDLEAARTGLAESPIPRLMVQEAEPSPMPGHSLSPGALLSVDDVARLLNVSPRTIRSWRRSGRLPRPLAIAGVVRWRSGVIDAWLRAQEDVA